MTTWRPIPSHLIYEATRFNWTKDCPAPTAIGFGLLLEVWETGGRMSPRELALAMGWTHWKARTVTEDARNFLAKYQSRTLNAHTFAQHPAHSNEEQPTEPEDGRTLPHSTPPDSAHRARGKKETGHRKETHETPTESCPSKPDDTLSGRTRQGLPIASGMTRSVPPATEGNSQSAEREAGSYPAASTTSPESYRGASADDDRPRPAKAMQADTGPGGFAGTQTGATLSPQGHKQGVESRLPTEHFGSTPAASTISPTREADERDRTGRGDVPTSTGDMAGGLQEHGRAESSTQPGADGVPRRGDAPSQSFAAFIARRNELHAIALPGKRCGGAEYSLYAEGWRRVLKRFGAPHMTLLLEFTYLSADDWHRTHLTPAKLLGALLRATKIGPRVQEAIDWDAAGRPRSSQSTNGKPEPAFDFDEWLARSAAAGDDDDEPQPPALFPC